MRVPGVFRCALARIGAALMLAVSLGGCTAVRLAYNNADTLVRYMASDYVDLEPVQGDAFRERLAGFHDWHRAHELREYAALLGDAAKRAEDGISASDVAWAAAALRTRYRQFAVQAAAAAAPVLVTLSPAQIKDMELKLAEANAKYARERSLDDPARRLRHSTRQMKKQFDDWLGSLTDAQEERIVRFVQVNDAIVLPRFEDRLRRQREGLALIRSVRDPAALAVRLAELFAQPEIGRTADYAAAAARHESALMQLVLEIDRSASSGQRAHAVRRMQNYAMDFQVLAGQKSVAKAP